jgi:hypothetical protein
MHALYYRYVRETPQYKSELFLEHENVCNFFRKIMFLLIDSVFLGKSIGILLLTVKRSSVRLRYSPPIIASLSVILLKGFFNMEGLDGRVILTKSVSSKHGKHRHI